MTAVRNKNECIQFSIEQKGQDKVRCKKMPYTFIYNSFLFPFPVPTYLGAQMMSCA